MTESSLAAELELLSPAHRLAFVAATAERMLPAYEEFVRRERWGDSSVMRSAIERVWAAVLGQALTSEEHRQLITATLEVIPDSEEFGSALASAAIEAGHVIHGAIECTTRPDPATCAKVALHAEDVVDLWVQVSEDLDSSDPQLEAKIDAHPLMQTERVRRREDLDLLRSWPTVEPMLVELLRTRDRDVLRRRTR